MTVRCKVLLVVLVAVLLPRLQAKAGLDVAFGAAVNVNDNTSLSSACRRATSIGSPRRRDVVAARAQSRRALGADVPLSTRSGREPRRRASRCGGPDSPGGTCLHPAWAFPPTCGSCPVSRQPGPALRQGLRPLEKHGRDNRAYRVDDRTCRDLVAVRVMHEYYGIPVDRAMDMRRDGRRIDRLVGDGYRTRHGKGGGTTGPARARQHEQFQEVSDHGNGGHKEKKSHK